MRCCRTPSVGVEAVALPVLPGTTDGDSPLLGPGAAELAEEVGLDLLAVLELNRRHGQGRRGRVTAGAARRGRERRPALGASRRRRRPAAPPTSDGPEPRWRGPPAAGPASRRRPGPGPDARPRGVRRRRHARVVRLPPPLRRSRAPSGRAGSCWPRCPTTRARRHPRPRGRRRRRRLALAHAGHGALEHQEPRLARRPGGRAGRRDRPEGRRSGTSTGSGPTASAASSASARPPPARPA